MKQIDLPEFHIKGEVKKGFENIAQAFEDNFKENDEIGASFCVMKGQEIIANLWGGYKDIAQTKIWQENTLVPVYSTSKPVAAIIIALLQDFGALNLDDEIGKLWPEFTENEKNVSIAQALSHQAGVPGFVNEIDAGLWLRPRELAKELAMQKPLWKVGTASGYHPLTWGYIASEICFRAMEKLGKDKSLGTILREEICIPLGIDFHIGLDEIHHERCAQIKKPTEFPMLGEITEPKRAAFLTKWSAPNRGGADWRKAEIPSANGHGTAKSLAQIFSIFASGGKIGDKQILTPASFEALTKSRIENDDLVLPFHLKFASGVMINNNKVYGPNENAFGHSGWGGSMAFGDSKAGISAAYVMNRQSNALMGDRRAQKLIAALYSAL